MDDAEREKIRAMCRALMPKAKKPERPLIPPRPKPKPVALHMAGNGRTGAGSSSTRSINGRLVQKCLQCNHRVEMPCRACHVRRLMEAGALPPLAK